MIPLMNHASYHRLRELKRELDTASPNIAHVFVPVASHAVGRAPFRILFVDGATRDYSEDRVATYEGAIQRDIEIAKNFLAKRQTPFWQFSYDVLCGVLERCKGASSNLHDLIGWSNLVKIGDIKGNPTQESLEKQAGLCIEQLRVEIAALRPDAIVLPTSNCAEDEILYPLFHRDGWNWNSADYDRVAFKRDPETGTPVVWTNHPQSMGPSGYRTAATRMTVELVARAVAGQEFPGSGT